MEKICANPECKKVFITEDSNHDDFCSFECWEKVNCEKPVEPAFEWKDII